MKVKVLLVGSEVGVTDEIEANQKRKGDGMGLLVEGVWRDEWYDTAKSNGRFVRQESSFRNQIRADGSTPFLPERGRYHLYVSLACPWAHRTLIFRKLKRLEPLITLSIVDPLMESQGWAFSEGVGCLPDSINGASFLHQIYTMADPKYTGRVTVPVLWDTKNETIVNNESSEIIRMFNSEFEEMVGPTVDYYPLEHQPEIDRMNQRIYQNFNNGVYRCGFATTQTAYEEAFRLLFEELDALEAHLSDHPYLVGDQLTEADWRFFVTLVRFDAVYVGHFKCNKKRIADYPALSAYLKKLFYHPGIAETVNFDHIKRHYYQSHKTINPTGIVPLGPEINW